MNIEKINKEISAVIVCREDDVHLYLPAVKELTTVCSFFYSAQEAFAYYNQHKSDILIISCCNEEAVELAQKVKNANPSQLIFAGIDTQQLNSIEQLINYEFRFYPANPFNEEAFKKLCRSGIKEILIQREHKLKSNYLEALLSIIEKSARQVLLLNADGQIEYANKQFLSSSGFSEDEIIGKSPVEFLINDENIRNIIEYNTQLLQDEGWSGEFKINKKNGELLWVRASVTPIKNDLGGSRHYLKMFENITDQKKYSENLSNLSGKINEKVREKTLELHKAKIKAEKANNTKTLFLAKISHELRTPLNGILGMTQLLQESKLNPQQSHNIDIISKSASSLLSIINDILDYSSIEAGKFNFEKKPFNIHDLINSSIDLLAVNARSKGISLSAKIDKSVPDILIGDPKRLQQALINVIGNAIKFTKEGFVSLQVKAIKKDSGFAELFFKVQDTGIGISEEAGDTIFEYYKTAETGPSLGGSGLGLAITKEIVEKMEGSIWFDSVPGNGSAFYFTAKFTIQPEEIEELKPYSIIQPAKEPKDYTKLDAKILIAEDSAINQEVIKQALELKECKVMIASTGKEAVDLFRKNDFDMIFMDLQMPELNGIEATKLIRESKQKNGKNIPIIGLTAHADEEYRRNCMLNGMNEFLTKPYRWTDIYEMVERFLLADPKIEYHKRQPVNEESLLENNGEASLCTSIQKFFNAYKRDMKKIREAINNKDMKKLPSLLQKFKVEAINIGAIKSSEYLNEMEYLCASGNIDLVDKILPELETELKTALEFLQENYIEPKMN